jgi:8-oxo-dGTP pyrophosphatase MutT (NUDIX family)
MTQLFNVFQKGLIRGSAHLPFDPDKLYAYVEHPSEGWRVYLRSCIFLHNIEDDFSNRQFLVVKKTGTRHSSPAWEPPKGQMEGKDVAHNNRSSVLDLLRENVIRETFEEAHITDIKNITHTGLAFQSQENDYPENHYFQYHIFQGMVDPIQIKQSFETFEWINEHPKGFARWRRDRREKDAVAWFNPRETRLNPRWTPDIVFLYLKNVKRIM